MIGIVVLAGTTAVVGWAMLLAPGAKPGVRLTGFVVGAFMSAVVWRAPRVGVLIADDGVVVRRWHASQSYGWVDIDAFEVGPGNNAVQPTYTLHLHLKDGRDLAFQALSASALLKRRTHVHDAVELLNEELARHRPSCPQDESGVGSST
jgi:hypothetical protein